VAGVLNNIEGLLIKFPAAAGIVTAVATACYVGAPMVKKFIDGLVEGSNDIPKSADALGRLNDELKTNAKRLKDLEDQGTLTNKQLDEYNRLTEESTRLEKEANAEKARRNELEKARNEEHAGNAEAGGIAAEAIRAGGGVDAILSQTAAGLTKESAELKAAQAALRKTLDDWNAAIQADPLGARSTNIIFGKREAAARQGVAAARQGIANQAGDLVVRARKGDVDAIRELERLNPSAPFEQATPEGMVEADAFEQDMLVDQPGRTRRGAAARRASNKLGADLTRQGQQGEAALARDQQAEAREMQKAVDKYAEGVRKIDENGPLAAFGLGQDFRDYAAGLGYGVDVGQMKTAGKQIQESLGLGHSKDQAMADAMESLLGNMREIAARHQEMEQRFRRVEQDANYTVPTLLDWGQ
jgi:hypothetical protein